MGPASKTSCNTSSRCIGEVDAVVKFEPKKMVKEAMKGGNREQGREKNKHCFASTYTLILGSVDYFNYKADSTFAFKMFTMSAKPFLKCHTHIWGIH